MLQRNLTLDYQGFPDKHDTVRKKRRKTAEEDNPVGYTCVYQKLFQWDCLGDS